MASSTWYVDLVKGSDSNNCESSTAACKTIGHAISLASSGDSVRIAPATYKENLNLTFDLNMVGSNASTTIIDGRGLAPAVTISSSSSPTRIALSNLTMENGWSPVGGGGILNQGGNLTVNSSVITGNLAHCYAAYCLVSGGGISNNGILTINNSTVFGNAASSTSTAYGGGIYNIGTMTINNSTLYGNTASSTKHTAFGGGIYNFGRAIMNNSTLASNSVTGHVNFPADGGGIWNGGTLKISSSTISLNTAKTGGGMGGSGGSATLKNTIIADNPGGNCIGNVASLGYNLSSDGTCSLKGAGDLINTEPMLGMLQNNGGLTQTMALPSGSPAIDSGNPGGCADGVGNLLKTDQRGMPRPDSEDSGGCDIGAYESQAD